MEKSLLDDLSGVKRRKEFAKKHTREDVPEVGKLAKKEKRGGA